MRLILGLILAVVAASAALLLLAWLASVAPGNVVAAALLGLVIFGAGFTVLRGLARSRPHEEVTPEDVASLDVFFVCGECGTEFRVEKIGQLQVPRHCGEPMRVERRPQGLSAN